MQIKIYTNNGSDTVAIINNDNKVTNFWQADAKGSAQDTVLEDALYMASLPEWHDHPFDIDLDDFEDGQTLFLTIRSDGKWECEDRDLLERRLMFHLFETHPIVQALRAL
jgi:hypothetical protein